MYIKSLLRRRSVSFILAGEGNSARSVKLQALDNSRNEFASVIMLFLVERLTSREHDTR